LGKEKQPEEKPAEAGRVAALYLILSFLAAGLLVSAIAWAARAIWPGRIHSVEERLILGLQAHSHPILTKFLLGVTLLGSSETLFIVLPLVGLLLARLRLLRGLTNLVLVSTAGGAALALVLKQVFERPRPRLEMVHVGGYSFPSGHSTLSLCLYGALAYLLLRANVARWQRILGAAACTLLVLMIGFSRMYLGVHYPSDVAAGYLAGSIWLAGCILAYRRTVGA
jgi:membrane-associated phospholipid phosphatase